MAACSAAVHTKRLLIGERGSLGLEKPEGGNE
jgi:hypothetical protein